MGAILVITLCTASACHEMKLYDPYMTVEQCEMRQLMLGESYAAMSGMRLEKTQCQKPVTEI